MVTDQSKDNPIIETAASAKIMIIEDHAVNREGYKTILRGLNYEVIAEAADPRAARERLAMADKPDVLLCDLKLPPSDSLREGINLLYSVREDHKGIGVIAYSVALNEWALRRILELGVSCLHPVDWNAPHTIDTAIHLVLANWVFYSESIRNMLASTFAGFRESKPPLTYHEMQIAAFHLQRFSNFQIKGILGGSERVIGNHITDIYRKAGLSDRPPATRAMELLPWFERVCAKYGFIFTPEGQGINLETWDPDLHLPKATQE